MLFEMLALFSRRLINRLLQVSLQLFISNPKVHIGLDNNLPSKSLIPEHSVIDVPRKASDDKVARIVFFLNLLPEQIYHKLSRRQLLLFLALF